jgi:hypothetical protein
LISDHKVFIGASKRKGPLRRVDFIPIIPFKEFIERVGVFMKKCLFGILLCLMSLGMPKKLMAEDELYFFCGKGGGSLLVGGEAGICLDENLQAYYLYGYRGGLTFGISASAGVLVVKKNAAKKDSSGTIKISLMSAEVAKHKWGLSGGLSFFEREDDNASAIYLDYTIGEKFSINYQRIILVPIAVK